MSLRNRLALLCIAIPAVTELGLGIVYFSSSTVMRYHQDAMGIGWTELAPGVRALFVTLVNGYGSTHLAVGIALCVLLFFPLRRGQAWARWAILAIGLPVLGATAYLSFRLADATGANVPWQGAVVLLLMFLAGVVLVDLRESAPSTNATDGA